MAERRQGKGRRPAQSNYGQLKVTVTFTRDGRADYRLYSKPYRAEWREVDCIAQGTERLGHFPADLHEALAVLSLIVENQRWRPESHAR